MQALKIIGRVRESAVRLGALMALLGVALTLAGCGGGGSGGSGPTQVPVTGKILRGETGAAPNPGATVTIGGQSVTTAADGTFTLNAPQNATTVSITATGAKAEMLPVTLTGSTNDLGTLFTSDTGYTANVTGRVITLASNQNTPVGGATVSLAGMTTKTAADGTFTLNNLPVDLGLNTVGSLQVGQVTATGFDVKPVTVDILRFALKAGANDIGDIVVSGGVSGTTPLPPYTVQVKVTNVGTPTANAQVSLAAGATGLGSPLFTDMAGNYFYWVVPGTYTATAIVNGASKTASVTLAQANMPVSVTIAFP